MKYFLTFLLLISFPFSLYASNEIPLFYSLGIIITLSFIAVVFLLSNYKKLLTTTRYYETLFEINPNPQLIVNKKEVIVGMNPAFELLLGIKKERLVGELWYERLMSSEHSLVVRHKLYSIKSLETLSVYLINSVGEVKEYELKLNTSTGLNGRKILSINDTCAVKSVVEELKETKEKLEKKSESLIQQSEQIKLTFDMAINAIAILDAEGNLSYCNTSLQEMLVYNESYFEHVGLDVIFGDEESLKSLLIVAKNDERIDKMHHRVKSRSGEEVDVTISVAYLNTLDQYFIVIQDVRKEIKYTQLLKQERDIYEERALRDGLLGIYNRAYINHALAKFIEEKKYFSLILFDADHFKDVNDKFGHIVGDKVLINIANTVQNSLRSGDIFARFGGEEFLVLIPRASLGEAVVTAQKLRQKIEDSYYELEEHVTCSFGVAEYHEPMSVNDIINASDKALYKAKECGRNCVMSISDEGVING